MSSVIDFWSSSLTKVDLRFGKTRGLVDSVTSKFVLCCISVQLGSAFVVFPFLLSLDGSMPLYQPYHPRGVLQLWKRSHEEAWYIRHKLSYEVKQVQLLDPLCSARSVHR